MSRHKAKEHPVCVDCNRTAPFVSFGAYKTHRYRHRLKQEAVTPPKRGGQVKSIPCARCQERKVVTTLTWNLKFCMEIMIEESLLTFKSWQDAKDWNEQHRRPFLPQC